MKRLSLLCSFVVLFAASAVQASVTDAPHNETNNMTCNTCHSYSLWWEFSPTSQSAPPDDHEAIVLRVCNQCHDPQKDTLWQKGHTSAIIT